MQRRYPVTRLRRNRHDAATRRLVAEARLSPHDLIWPIFVTQADTASPVDGFADVVRHPLGDLPKVARRAVDLGIPVLAVFPDTPADKRDDRASEAVRPDNLMNRAISQIKQAEPDILVMADVALDCYTSHGHDGLWIDGDVHNDQTIEVLVQQALIQAKAGADILGPSDMMDGRVGAIRTALEGEGLTSTRIMSYAAKYASALYGPFRAAVGSASTLIGDKKSYQLDPANSDEAVHSAAMDLQEGADMVMVKPGLPYLDIVYRLKHELRVPTFAYHVSGEYAMMKAYGDPRLLMESLLAFKRAGADGILTYGAAEAAQDLNA
ncbi:MAG: porphobilinogen synthase [Pseudomonadota bacterium]